MDLDKIKNKKNSIKQILISNLLIIVSFKNYPY